MINKAAFILLVFILPNNLWAQDTLVFINRKDPANKIRLPLDQFDVKLKAKDARSEKVVLHDFINDTLILKTRNDDDDNAPELRYRSYLLSHDTVYTKFQKDSILNSIEFSKELRISSGDIEFVTIVNSDIRRKRGVRNTIGALTAITSYSIPFTAFYGILIYQAQFLLSFTLAGILILPVELILLELFRAKKLSTAKWKIVKA